MLNNFNKKKTQTKLSPIGTTMRKTTTFRIIPAQNFVHLCCHHDTSINTNEHKQRNIKQVIALAELSLANSEVLKPDLPKMGSSA